MKKLTIIIVWACYCLYFPASAQTIATHKYLQIGDKMPDLTITNLLNAHQKTFNIGANKGKLILFDFFNTWCSTCIHCLPKMDSLQRQFHGRLEILIVNPNKGETKRAFQVIIDRTKAWSPLGFSLPIAFQDTAITHLFKYRTLPHIVWIGQDGRVVAITGHEEVTASNVAKVIAHEPVNFQVKTD